MSHVDRVVGTAVTLLAVGVAAYIAHYTIYQAEFFSKTNKKSRHIEDLYFRARYAHRAGIRKDDHVWHQGSCHCLRVQFNVFAPSELHAVDIPSKLRFPRLSIGIEDFQLLCDESLLSIYPLDNADGECVGAYSFCAFCGMQVMYSAGLQPQEIQINLDCLNPETITQIHIAYHSSGEKASANNSPSSPPKYIYINDNSHRQQSYSTPLSHLQYSQYNSYPNHSTLHHQPQYSVYDNMDTQQSESTEDLYTQTLHNNTPNKPPFSHPHAVYHQQNVGNNPIHNMSRKYSDDEEHDDQSFGSEEISSPGLKESRRDMFTNADELSNTSYSSAHKYVAREEEDVSSYYFTLKKFLHRHV